MITLSNETLVAFDRRMDRSGVAAVEREDYRKWVRFYLDFCQKYGHSPRSFSSLDPFLAKLASKKQPVDRLQQASDAVRLLIGPAFVRQEFGATAVVDRRTGSSAEKGGQRTASPGIPAAGSGVGRGASWETEYRELEGAIKMRNYSGKTLSTYRMWVRKFQSFVRSMPSSKLGGEEAKQFLSDLAVRHEAAGSTQNQAFNALLFFYRHVLGREFGKLEGVVRAAPERKHLPPVPEELTEFPSPPSRRAGHWPDKP